MNNTKSLENVKYVYYEDLWFLPIKEQFSIMCCWNRKINPYNKKLYYINPKLYYYQQS